MRNYRFRIYFRAQVPEGVAAIMPAIATREYRLGDPFPVLGPAWDVIDKCMMLDVKDIAGVEFCEGDIVQMENGQNGVVMWLEHACEYAIITGEDTYAVAFVKDGRIRHRIIGHRSTMPDKHEEIIKARYGRKEEL